MVGALYLSSIGDIPLLVVQFDGMENENSALWSILISS